MKKTIIAVVLAVVLVAGGLGGFAYAQTEPVNQVGAHFDTTWVYDVPGDAFTNGEVTGRKEWCADIWNEPDETQPPVSAPTLSLDSELVFDLIEPDPVTMGPPTYEWSFGDVLLEGFHADAAVRFLSPDPSPVTFTPGFDASRSADITEFSAPGIQTLTITLTPQETTERLHIYVSAREDDLVNPVITSPTTDEEMGIDLDPDGRWLRIDPTGLELNITYTYDITIEVTPKVPQVEYMPHVIIEWREDLAEGTTIGSSFSYTVEPMSTWTWRAEPWNTEGSYVWHWREDLARGVDWRRCSREIIQHEPMKGEKLVGIGSLGSRELPDGNNNAWWTSFQLTNPDCVAEITIERISIIRGDGTVIYEGPLLWQKVEDNEVVKSVPITTLKPHEIRGIGLQWYMPDPDDPNHDWMNPWEARLLPAAGYTVEVFWTAPGKSLPLIGWTYKQHGFLNDEGVPLMSDEGIYVGVVTGFGTPMVNMKQKLEPED